MLAPAIAKTGTFGADTGGGRAGLIDSRRVAAVAEEIATKAAPHKGKTYWGAHLAGLAARLARADSLRIRRVWGTLDVRAHSS